jgi:hypothetical protein
MSSVADQLVDVLRQAGVTRVVLSGGVGRMLEMARSNLRNIPGAALVR